METEVCAMHTKPNKVLTWMSRAIALLFLYTSVTLSQNVTLENTEVVQAIKREYPTWSTVVTDIVIAFLIFGLLALLGFRILQFSKHHHISKKWIERLTTLENKFIRNFLSFCYSLAHSTIAIVSALVVWNLARILIVQLDVSAIHVATFDSQPVVMLMGVFSLALLIHSVHFWSMGIAKLFCIRCRL